MHFGAIRSPKFANLLKLLPCARGLLSEQVFSLFGALWLTGITGAAAYVRAGGRAMAREFFANCDDGRWALVIQGGGVA